ncbi:thiolase family protein [Niveispirillum sp. BGYR6]|uniref:thiolase family protein n=1 Tax=Niveispirillum sp. BGYR6 TaxID=2971249 RepID=UPI0022B9C04E|nr:thiolase family protein [Niveispirillum sp. BGYR6]MDG5496157.1 thiolase family protein [Niveispirillum sp. BGYR6]
MSDVAIVGIGIHPFGRTPDRTGLEQGAFAVRQALADAGITWGDVQFAYGGSQDGGNADTMVEELGLTGLQFINVANGCATGGSALISAYGAIRSGQYDLGLVVGFDKHEQGSFRVRPADWGLPEWYGEVGFALTTQFFAMKIQRYMALHGITDDALIRVAEKAFANGALNPNAWRRRALSYEEIAQSTMISDPLRQYMFCSPGEGAVALILASPKKAAQLTRHPVWLKGAAMRTRGAGSFEVFSPSLSVEDGEGATPIAARAAFTMAGIGPEDIDIAQLQDTESGAEIMHMAENGFCRDGEQEKWLREGWTRLDGKLPVNTDGGCLANGEPIGASGLRQVYETVLQLRGDAGARQVPKRVSTGYTHVYGAPGVSAVTILAR